MGDAKVVGELEIGQDLDHTRAAWRVQRVGWVVMLLIIVAALAGAFGRGPMAKASADAGGLRVDYDRFARHGATTTLAVEVASATGPADPVTLWVDRAFLDNVEVEQITPEPAGTEARGDVVRYTFAAPERTTATRITLTIRPDAYWSQQARVGIEGGGSVAVRQFVYP